MSVNYSYVPDAVDVFMKNIYDEARSIKTFLIETEEGRLYSSAIEGCDRIMAAVLQLKNQREPIKPQ